MRYFIHIAYDGGQYSGWQRHPGVLSVQEVLEICISGIFKKPLEIIGCGRTDAQVHASQFFFHVDIEQTWDFDLLFRLNKMLPNNIAVFDIIPVEGKPHARFDAFSRTYDYFIHRYKDPFLSQYSSLYLYPSLNLDKMNTAVKLLLLYDDYRAFCKSPLKYEHTICHISAVSLSVSSNEDKIHFQISSNRFLGGMIRIIVADLLAIGRGELSLDEFTSYFESKENPSILKPAYPEGLFLSKVTYPYLDLASRSSFASYFESQNPENWQSVG